MSKEKIGILLGSFDPIHIGHIAMATSCLNEGLVDEVLFTPTMQNVFKKRRATDFLHRCNMISSALIDLPNCKLNSIDCMTNPPYYSSNTLKLIKEIYPDEELYLIFGIDTLCELGEWHESEWIMNNFKIIEVTRGIRARSVGDIPRVQLDLGVSSTMIRKLISEKKEIIPYVRQSVKDYIKYHNLYNEELELHD